MKRSELLWACKNGSVKTNFQQSFTKHMSVGVGGCQISMSYSQLHLPRIQHEEKRFYWFVFGLLLIEIQAVLFSGLTLTQ